MSGPVIQTPRGKVYQTKTGTVTLKWNANFRPKWQKQYSRAQRFVDSEVLRLCEPYTPLRTGMLVKSGILGTEVGSGLVTWIAPYARRQYYSPRKVGSETGPLRGPYWFERVKGTYKKYLINGARKIAGDGRRA